MSFLFPAALALAGLTVIPLLLHLVRRETDRRVPFPSLRYLQSAQRESARSMRIRDRMLVAARVGIVALLALAAAQPLIGTGDARSHRPTDLVLALDNTASMDRLSDGRTLLESARQALAVSLSHATPQDRVWLLSAVDGIVVAGGSADEAARLLPAIRPSDAGASLALAIRTAASAIPASPGRARELHIFTDLQAGSFAGRAEIDDGWAVRVMQVAPDGNRNGRVASLSVGPSHPVPPGASLTVTARIEAESDSGGSRSPEDETVDAAPEARLLVDGRTAAIRTANWGTDVSFSIPAPDPGSHVVRVEIDPTGLRADDGRQVGISVARPAGVRLVGDSDSDGEFIGKAIETLEADGRVRLGTGRTDVVIQVAGAPYREPGVPDRPAARILVPPSDQLQLAAFNRELASLGIPWRAEPDPAAGVLRLADAGIPVVTGETVTRRYLLQPGVAPSTPVDSVILRTADGEAWLVRGRAPETGVYLLIGSALVPEATTLPASVGMIEFVDALVSRWSRPGDPGGSLEAGEETTLPSRADSLAGPDGPPVHVEGGAPWRPRIAGAWRIAVRSDTGRDTRFVGVNVPAAESNPATLDTDGLASAIGSARDLRVSSGDSWPDEIFAARRGRNITAFVLAVALVLMAVETWLSGARRPRATRADGHEPAGTGG
ncbi:MAG: BatA and WFA domain-containing protein [marine benthic group bacterium]|nr:BatA and WFA domain-containing protein [Gemmatimonadota bacterium]